MFVSLYYKEILRVSIFLGVLFALTMELEMFIRYIQARAPPPLQPHPPKEPPPAPPPPSDLCKSFFQSLALIIFFFLDEPTIFLCNPLSYSQNNAAPTLSSLAQSSLLL